MKAIVPAAVGAVVVGVAAPVVMLLAAGTAPADTGPAAENDQVTVSEPPPTPQQKLKKEWIRSDGTSVFF